MTYSTLDLSIRDAKDNYNEFMVDTFKDSYVKPNIHSMSGEQNDLCLYTYESNELVQFLVNNKTNHYTYLPVTVHTTESANGYRHDMMLIFDNRKSLFYWFDCGNRMDYLSFGRNIPKNAVDLLFINLTEKVKLGYAYEPAPSWMIQDMYHPTVFNTQLDFVLSTTWCYLVAQTLEEYDSPTALFSVLDNMSKEDLFHLVYTTMLSLIKHVNKMPAIALNAQVNMYDDIKIPIDICKPAEMISTVSEVQKGCVLPGVLVVEADKAPETTQPESDKTAIKKRITDKYYEFAHTAAEYSKILESRPDICDPLLTQLESFYNRIKDVDSSVQESHIQEFYELADEIIKTLKELTVEHLNNKYDIIYITLLAYYSAPEHLQESEAIKHLLIDESPPIKKIKSVIKMELDTTNKMKDASWKYKNTINNHMETFKPLMLQIAYLEEQLKELNYTNSARNKVLSDYMMTAEKFVNKCSRSSPFYSEEYQRYIATVGLTYKIVANNFDLFNPLFVELQTMQQNEKWYELLNKIVRLVKEKSTEKHVTVIKKYVDKIIAAYNDDPKLFLNPYSEEFITAIGYTEMTCDILTEKLSTLNTLLNDSSIRELNNNETFNTLVSKLETYRGQFIAVPELLSNQGFVKEIDNVADALLSMIY
jgi:hypothetical protein